MPERDWNRVHQIAPEPQPGRVTRWASWAATVVLVAVLGGTIGACTPYWRTLRLDDVGFWGRQRAREQVKNDTPGAASFRFAVGAAAGVVVALTGLVTYDRRRRKGDGEE